MTCQPLTKEQADELRAKYWPKYPPIHLWTDLKYVYVSIQVDGKWVEVIREIHDSPFSHIVEPGGIERCIALQSGESP